MLLICVLGIMELNWYPGLEIKNNNNKIENMSSRALVVHTTAKQKGRDQLRNAFCGRFLSHKKNFCFYQHDSARCFHGDVKLETIP